MNKPHTLYCDASDTCIGACLTQPCETDVKEIYRVNNNEKPIYFLSHRLSKTQQKWPVIEKEAFAIHYALQKLDHYLHGAEFIIKTDHKPSKYLLESPMQNKKVQLWALGISGYNCKIEYISGVQNTCADLLSRSPPYAENQEDDGEVEVDVSDKVFEINTFNSNQFNPKHFASCEYQNEEKATTPIKKIGEFDMSVEQQKDPSIQFIFKQLQSGKDNKLVQKRFIIIDQIVYYIMMSE